MTTAMGSTAATEAAALEVSRDTRPDARRLSGLTPVLGLAGRFAAGAAVTLGLFALMIRLIGEPAPFEDRSGPLVYVNWEEVREDLPPEPEDRRIVKPAPPKTPPLNRMLPEFDGDGGSGIAVQNVVPDLGGTTIRHFGLDNAESLPIVKVAAVYPRRAQTRGIEGYAVYRFTITKHGTVADPVLIDAMPAGIFDRAALNALLKFKYRPKIVDGEAVPVRGAVHRISFELTDA
ncbi:MAG: TonB family protein [Pseudomonadota bacterium]